jgi:hypothetical protein
LAELQFSLTVYHPIEVAFGLIANLAGYDRWLPGSASFSNVATLSPGPIGLGSTYTDRGPLSVMRGEVTEYDPPRAITFLQEQRLAPLPGRITVQVRYALRAVEQKTAVDRTVSARADGLLKLALPVVVWTVRRESWRILYALRRYRGSGL